MKVKREKVVDYTKNPLAIISDAAKKLLKYKKSGSVLDVGTGTGRNALFLAKKGFGVTALDSVKSKLVELKKIAKSQRVPLKFIHINITRYRPSKKYDVVLALVSLHFLKAKQVPKIIKRMKEYTKDGGLNVVSVHTTKNTNKSSYRPHLFKRNELKKYYSDWQILEYNEAWGHLFRTTPNSKPVKKHRAEIIARKI